jgi:hypothetical protein
MLLTPMRGRWRSANRTAHLFLLDTGGLESVPGYSWRGFWPHEKIVSGLKLKTEGLDRKDNPAALFHSVPGRFHLGQRDGFDGNLQVSGGSHIKKRGDGGQDPIESNGAKAAAEKR